MGSFFSVDWPGAPFVVMSVPHLAALLGLVLFNIGLSRFSRSSEAIKRRVRIGIVAVLWTNEVIWHLWLMRSGTWDLQHALPLELCSIFVWVGGVMLLTRSRWLYDLAYFLGVAGALQALATPNIGMYGFPHYRYWAFFVSHGLIVTTVAWMTYGEGFRPTRRSLLRSVVVGAVMMLVVLAIDLAIGADYMFLAHKPETASLLDALPAWPYYLPWLLVVGVLMFAVMYAPWEVADRLRASRNRAVAASSGGNTSSPDAVDAPKTRSAR
jgi:hypothetical integral membrane protein (TIGR02206 family)